MAGLLTAPFCPVHQVSFGYHKIVVLRCQKSLENPGLGGVHRAIAPEVESERFHPAWLNHHYNAIFEENGSSSVVELTG